MTTYAWPGFPVSSFEMRIMPNVRTFVGPYTPTVQVLDLLGERWQIGLTLSPTVRDTATAAALEAFFDRLKAQANAITLWHVKRPRPLGTLTSGSPLTWTWTSGALSWTWTGGAMTWTSGDPYILADIAQLANTATIVTLPGRTLKAGDQIGLAGQLVRIMADAVADGSGNMPIEFQPRARALIPRGTLVAWDTPTANFILKPGTLNVPTVWTPDTVEGATIELIEVF